MDQIAKRECYHSLSGNEGFFIGGLQLLVLTHADAHDDLEVSERDAWLVWSDHVAQLVVSLLTGLSSVSPLATLGLLHPHGGDPDLVFFRIEAAILVCVGCLIEGVHVVHDLGLGLGVILPLGSGGQVLLDLVSSGLNVVLPELIDLSDDGVLELLRDGGCLIGFDHCVICVGLLCF